ncbi:Transcription factor PIF6 [Cardamine amara subsp. amara]|uniref:Transcription factor PIF6 n=1 Tax=Cardamine amara subsp. amara TaxID=228776 RepID=A0ABD1BBE2_CARAN
MMIMFLPSDYCCRLHDPEYMELVFENGQILEKCQRSNVSLQNQSTIPIMDLYEAEYNEDFKKSIPGCCGGSIKNLGDTQVVQELDVVASTDGTNMLTSNKHLVDYDYPKNIDFIPPDEQSVVAEWSVYSSFDASYTDFTEDSEGSSYLSSSLDDDESPRVSARTRKALVKRKRSKQRKDINKKMRTLQDLLPNSHKDDNESMLDEAINYMTTLQYQVQMMMMMGNRFVTPSMMLPMGPDYSQMGLATCMQMGVPQFMPAPVPRPGLPGTTDAHMLRFLNHPGLMPMQNSAFFTPMDNCYPQSVPPSCVTFPNQLPNPTSGKSSGKL